MAPKSTGNCYYGYVLKKLHLCREFGAANWGKYRYIDIREQKPLTSHLGYVAVVFIGHVAVVFIGQSVIKK